METSSLLLKKNRKAQELMLEIKKEDLSYWFDKAIGWDSIKIFCECIKSGADKNLALDITEEIETSLEQKRVSPNQIKNMVFNLLKAKKPEIAEIFGARNGLL